MQTEITQQQANHAKEETQLVTFLLKDEEFGFDIMQVQEIIRLPKMAKVPRTPEHVEGIANLRGVILPIIDMRTRFGMERVESTDRTRVLVVDINGVKTGLRVDRVKQVTRVLRSDIEQPPVAIRGSSSHSFLEGVVKLDEGRRIIMALNAGEICQMGEERRKTEGNAAVTPSASATASSRAENAGEAIQQMVTFRIAKEEFAFPMEFVREILRVEAPKQVPDVPDYVLGVLTVRGRILPIVDLRRLLHQPSMAEEVAAGARSVREDYAAWVANAAGLAAPERLRSWISATTSSSQVLMELLSKLRGLNERLIKHLRSHGTLGELAGVASQVLETLTEFERQVEANIREDQRIIVVDSGGVVTGLVVDHVNEVMNVMKKLLDPPPVTSSAQGLALSAVAKLDNGNRLILLLDVSNLMRDEKLGAVAGSAAAKAETSAVKQAERADEMQLVTFLLGGEEYGVPISQIQEIDRMSKITKVPKASRFVEGVTNLRGEVIPVLDTRKRFELETREADDRTRILIVDMGGVKTGLVVDSVREVLSLSKKDIAPPPESIHSSIQQRFISGIGKVSGGKRMIVLLDVEKILSTGERAELADVAAQER